MKYFFLNLLGKCPHVLNLAVYWKCFINYEFIPTYCDANKRMANGQLHSFKISRGPLFKGWHIQSNPNYHDMSQGQIQGQITNQ